MYIVFLTVILLVHSSLAAYKIKFPDLNNIPDPDIPVKVNKCCEKDEMMVDNVCRLVKAYNDTVWTPRFKSVEDGNFYASVKNYQFIHGVPDCESSQQRSIYYLEKSEDELQLLEDGRLRHLIHHSHESDSIEEEYLANNVFSIHETIPIPDIKEPTSYIHDKNKYCMDKVLITSNRYHWTYGEYALVCVPEVKINWRDTDFLMTRVLDPLFHSIAIILYLLVAIIYFVLPTLRDYPGNLITSLNVSLIVTQIADLVRMFSVYSNHIDYLVADMFFYVALLAAFVWLNVFGMYIWNTFRSRNVFVRIPDVRRYCYSLCVMVMTVFFISTFSLIAHLYFHSTKFVQQVHFFDDYHEDVMGWVGLSLFFIFMGLLMLMNLYFYFSIKGVLARMNVYGRIHYKLIGCFRVFVQVSITIMVGWICLMLTWTRIDGWIYTYIFVNLFQAIMIFYSCIISQHHVRFLLKRCCCSRQPIPGREWGDEMTHMNGDIY